MTTELSTDVEWPAWEDAAFYNQDFDTIFASFAAQRRAAPVYWYEPPNFATGFWVLSKWEHQRFVGSHPELFSSRYGFAVGDASEPATVMHLLPDWAKEALDRPGVTPAEARGIVALGKLSMGDPNFESLILSDPPRHGLIRDIMMKALKPSLVRSQKARIADLTDAFLDEIEPGVETDFVTSIGRVPAALMTDLIGVPGDMRERFIEMSSAQMAAITIDPNRDPEEAERIQRSAAAFHDYCDELLAERRAGGGVGDDLVSVIARSEWDGAEVPDGMAISFIHTFVNAGETTRAHLSFAAMTLAEHPEQRRLLAEEPDLIRNAVEEVLRFRPLNWTGCRTATQDIELGGQQITAGDYVVMAYASANRDEDVWERPDEFDVTRAFDHDHQGFGYGEHSCPGALLAHRLRGDPGTAPRAVPRLGARRSSRTLGQSVHPRDDERPTEVLCMTTQDTPAERQYEWVLFCPCGTRLAAPSEDEIVEVSFAHLREAHPDMADEYEREHILFMAQKFVKKA